MASATPTVQIFGFNDCQDTRKARRFFSERRIPVHYVDLDERPASMGELRRFEQKFGAAALIDRESRRFRDLGLRVRGDSPQRVLERALTEPRILKTPLVRSGTRLTVGYIPEEWRAWAEAEKTAMDRPRA
jgi:arsenate reductase-like glutaredoxin family protein